MPMGEPDAVPQTTSDGAGVPQLVAAGIWRIPLPLPFALRWVNVYLLISNDERVLIDCGLGTRKTIAVLTQALAAFDMTFADLTTLVLTHGHPDHIGLAGDIATAMRTPRVIVLDREVAGMVQVWGARSPHDFAAMRTFHLRAGMPEPLTDAGVDELLSLAGLVHLPPVEAITTVTDGESIMLGGRDWQILWVPGHAEGHLALVAEGVIVLGDHILPRISPNVSYYPGALADPIRNHIDALDRVAARDAPGMLALPGHGLPFTQIAARAAELQVSHAKRTGHLRAALARADTPRSAFELTQAIFPGRLTENADYRLALGETLAHLIFLQNQGLVTVDDRDAIIRYQPVS